MAKYTVYFRPNGSWCVTLDIPDEELAHYPDNDDLIELLTDRAYEECPNDVCAQCGGWGQNYGLDFGDLQLDEITDYESGELLYREKQ